MIAATIGKTFLKTFKEKTGKNYSAKEFFEQEYHPLFYGASKYMQWITNSSFVQGLSANPKGEYGIREKIKGLDGKTLIFSTDEEALDFYNSAVKKRTDFLYCKESDKKKLSKKGIEFLKSLNKNEREKLLNDFTKKVERTIENNNFEGSMAIGFPADSIGEFATTSGQVSDINIQFDINDIYYSWIGNGLGVGVEGGYKIFFDNGEILFSIYEGWKEYRKILNDKTINIIGNQVDTWNGQWLSFVYSKDFRPDFDTSILNQLGFFKIEKEVFKVDTIFWGKIAFGLSNQYSDKPVLACICSFAERNKTLGYFPFHFGKAQRLKKYYSLLFGKNIALTDASSYEKLFGLKLYKACQYGLIGLQSLQPSSLFYDINNEKKKISLIQYRTFKTWLTAMINKEETLELTGKISEKLHQFEQSSKGTDRRAIVEKILKSSRKDFLNLWADIVEQTPKEGRTGMKEISDMVYFMTNEDYGYFIALLRLDYRYQDK